MPTVLRTPEVDELGEVLEALRDWQREGGPMHLHPGDVGWYWRFGPQATAASLRTWRRDGRILAVGQVDPELVRLAISPEAAEDRALAGEIARDVSQPERGVLPGGVRCLEVRSDGPLTELLLGSDWERDLPWSPFSRPLRSSVEGRPLRVEVVGAELASVRTAVQRSAFEGSTFTDERWTTMASAPPYADARCLVGFDDRGVAVAATTVWSAGAGKPGLLEPLGVHREHRRHGYGTAIALAGAAALREMGSSSATVCTPSSNTAAVATYRAAGFRQLPVVRDLRRRASGAGG